MPIIRLILYIMTVYFGFHFFKGLFSADGSEKEVKGKNTNKPIDLKKENVEDAKYKDIEED